MKVSAQFAFSHFEDISAAIDRGEDVEIERPGKSGLHLVLRPTETSVPNSGRRVLGALAGQMRVPTEQEWAEMDQEIQRQMVDEPLMTTGQI